jgi:hypothetical protein
MAQHTGVIGSDKWLPLVRSSPRDVPVAAQCYRGISFKSTFEPVVLGCSDGLDYIVKAPKNAELTRAVCNEQVIGRLARALCAPVPAAKVVQIPQTLVDAHSELAGIPAGPAHGSRYLPNTSKIRQGIKHADVPANRGRFALLAILYGLAGVAVEHQFFYEDETQLVWSFDHGHFFPGGPNWTIDTLAAGRPATADKRIVAGCALTPQELHDAARHLDDLSAETIAQAVASPHDAWGLSDPERVALAQHFETRMNRLRA